MSGSPERVLTPAEVADVFAVDPSTVSRWVRRGWLPSFTTPAGHRRFRWSDVEPLLRTRANG